ncbi:RimM N-terminal domain [Musa troglodytarum]|uniref:RimM N-terminal domain n=1 Tax=Musa troglodytarum TaxID=320322 RepID=A0A9E7H3H1_9LILI|nr:RimM N-terminal domain [Musa troglodytarum]
METPCGDNFDSPSISILPAVLPSSHPGAPRKLLAHATLRQSTSMHRPSLLAPPRPLPLPFRPPPRPHRRFPRGPAVLHRPPRTPLDATSRRPLPILALLSGRSMVHSLHHLFPSFVGNTASLTLFLMGPVAVAAEGVLGSSEEGSDDQKAKFVEVGYVSSTHGIKGELRVMPSTDFPELRFCTPGPRWLRTRISGKELISEVQLTGGRGHPGQKSWIVSLSGIDTVDKAKQIVGSTFLVKEDDRPDLEEGELYTPDLVGMRVVLKESGTLVGTVANVFNFGASDLLEVMLASDDRQDRSSSSKLNSTSCGRHVWVPFVEAIVPEVDMDKREMLITPPKGLLELNLHSDMRPKKERRQLVRKSKVITMEWKERKRLQQHLIPAKKKLAEMCQTHVLEGLKIGEKVQKSLLARQIVNIDWKLLQHALQSINKPFHRVSHEYLRNHTSKQKDDSNYRLYKEGLQLLSRSKTAIIVIINGNDCDEGDSVPNDGGSKTSLGQFEDLLFGCNGFMKVEEESMTVPLIVVSPAHLIQSYRECLSDNDYFGMNSEKVWVLEELQLPVVSIPIDQNGSKILLKSPWEILQAPIGSGGFFSLLLSHNILPELNKMGVEYVQVCSLNDKATILHPLFLGLVSSCRADVGIIMFESSKGEDECDMIFSMRHIIRISRQIEKLQFCTIPEQHVHVEQVDNELVTNYPDAPNSYRLHCPMYASLNSCSLDATCVVKVFE